MTIWSVMAVFVGAGACVLAGLLAAASRVAREPVIGFAPALGVVAVLAALAAPSTVAAGAALGAPGLAIASASVPLLGWTLLSACFRYRPGQSLRVWGVFVLLAVATAPIGWAVVSLALAGAAG